MFRYRTNTASFHPDSILVVGVATNDGGEETRYASMMAGFMDPSENWG